MSSILKALEKVEEAQSGRRSGAAGFVKARERRSPWVLPVAVLSGALVAALATFAAMGGFSRHAASAPQGAVVAQQEPAAAPAPVANAQAATKQAVQVQTAPKLTAPGAVSAASVAAPAKAAAAPAKGSAASVHNVAAPAKAVASNGAKSVSGKGTAKAGKKDRKGDEKSAKRERKERLARERERERERSARRAHRERESRRQAVAEPAKAVAPPASAPAAVPVATAAAHAPEKPHHPLRVTGIAWQKDSASSVVMINGRSVQQGATVDGYKVEQIYEDKVRLSGAGGRIEVPLGAGE
jgi:general secretion pathway protein B